MQRPWTSAGRVRTKRLLDDVVVRPCAAEREIGPAGERRRYRNTELAGEHVDVIASVGKTPLKIMELIGQAWLAYRRAKGRRGGKRVALVGKTVTQHDDRANRHAGDRRGERARGDDGEYESVYGDELVTHCASLSQAAIKTVAIINRASIDR